MRILQRRAAELGADLRFETEAEPDLDLYLDFDLVIATDGGNSRFRQAYAPHFEVEIQKRVNYFQWLGTDKHFEAFNFIFKELKEGWIWAHAYRFEDGLSTFIPECSPDTWQRLGFGEMSQEDSCRVLEKIFARHLDGHALMSNAGHIKGHAWLNFRRVHCGKWRHRNLILAGDAAHTAHFSIGSGTKLGLEDAIELADALNSGGATDEALNEYEQSRRLEVIKLQSAARNSTEWFENVPRYARFAPQQFNYSLLTRSQRVSHENLRLRDRKWLTRMERWYSHRATGSARAVAPMFVPYRIKGMELANRVVVAPMDMYSAVDGVVGDFHLVHLGARAQGGAGLVFTEMSCVSPEGRITPGCAGMYSGEHAAAYRRIVDFVHANSQARIALQIGHSGPKGSTRLMWEGMDQPLESGNWEVMGPSERSYRRGGQLPRPMTRADMDEIIEQFRRATRLGLDAGFDWLELHCAHGYLLSSFISPLSNRRRGRVRRLSECAAAFSARGSGSGAAGLAGRQTLVGAHFRYRLGQERRHRRRLGEDRPRHDRGRSGPHSCLRRPDHHPRPARLRAHVSDAVFGPDPQRGRSPPRSRSATSTKPTTSTVSWRPDGPICARWPGLT